MMICSSITELLVVSIAALVQMVATDDILWIQSINWKMLWESITMFAFSFKSPFRKTLVINDSNEDSSTDTTVSEPIDDDPAPLKEQVPMPWFVVIFNRTTIYQLRCYVGGWVDQSSPVSLPSPRFESSSMFRSTNPLSHCCWVSCCPSLGSKRVVRFTITSPKRHIRSRTESTVGETDVNPIGPIGKVTQLLFSAMPRKSFSFYQNRRPNIDDYVSQHHLDLYRRSRCFRSSTCCQETSLVVALHR